MMRPTFADHQLDDDKVARVRAAFEPHLTPTGAHFVRPMHMRLLRRTSAAARHRLMRISWCGMPASSKTGPHRR
jgi:hypothetical protein